jgi:predicted amidohydrolase
VSVARTVQVALAQVDPVLGDVEGNGRRALEVIERAHLDGADLVVFPELSLTGYALGGVADDVALRLDDEVVRSLARASRSVDVVVGLVEQGPVTTYNSALYLADGAVAHVHRKTHLPTYGRFEEHKHYSAGSAVRAFDTRFGRFGMLICFDAWQPPLPYIAVHDGAGVLIVTACSSLEPGAGMDPAELEQDWAELLRVTARFLATWIVFVNRVGDEAGVTFWGGSCVVDPWGRVVAQAPRAESAVVHAEVDVAAVRRRRREAPLLKESGLELVRREVGRLVDGRS